MKRLISIICVLFVLVSCVSAQKANTAAYSKLYDRAEIFLNKYQYSHALSIYLKIDSLTPDNSNINYKIGLCYFNSSNEKLKSIEYFEKAKKNVSENYREGYSGEINAPINTFLYIGKAYHLNYEFEKAIESFQIFNLYLFPEDISLIEETSRAIKISNNAKQMVLAPVSVSITNLGENINTPYADYSPLIFGDENTLIYTSRRPETTGGKLTLEGLYYPDIYISHKLNHWEKAIGISNNINTSLQETGVGLSFDGQTLFLYQSEGKKGALLQSELKGKEWTNPHLFNSNKNIENNVSHLSLSADGNVLYFVSNMQGGHGGKDIWMCKKLPNGTFGLPINLGPEVNTKFDEDAPFIHPDGKYLFFSSQGHNTMGGFDNFFTELVNDKWSESINLGYPINTPDDDVFYVSSADGKRSYFSSNRKDGYGDQDIYMAIWENNEPKPLTILTGCVRLSGDLNLLKKTEIHVKNKETNEIFVYRPNSVNGKYIMALNIGNYHVSYVYNDIEFYSEEIFVTDWIFNLMNKEIELNLIQINDDCIEPDVILGQKGLSTLKDELLNSSTEYKSQKRIKENSNNKPESKIWGIVNFDFGKIVIEKETNDLLKSLADTIKINNNLFIELVGHTDNVGKDNFNKELSRKRALMVKGILSKNGIPSEKITIKWMGSTKPIDDNNTEEGRAKNRRVELVLIQQFIKK